jgi:hypothetical protein
LTLSGIEAQTILSGDHIVEGEFEVGTMSQEGGIKVTGGTGSTASPGISVTGDGGVLFVGRSGTGTLPGAIPMEGGGRRMMWYPGKAAFRAGFVSSNEWDDEFTGYCSVAFGRSMASDSYSAAMSDGDSLGIAATAMSGGWAESSWAVAMSGGSVHESPHATVMSGGVAFFGEYSTAMSLGWAEGKYTIAGGMVVARAFRSVVFGSFNVVNETESSHQWNEKDSIFVIGNGTGVTTDPPELRYRNAFVILKNGDIQIPKRQGDILMGEFGEP